MGTDHWKNHKSKESFLLVVTFTTAKEDSIIRIHIDKLLTNRYLVDSPIKLSVITACYNAERYIQDTFNSIRLQSVRPYEYIVVDGGSTDTTLSLIKANRDIITSWISESDSGISDAMNKGISIAKGDYILFIHSDDYLYSPDALKQVMETIVQNRSFNLFGFAVLFCRENTSQIWTFSPFGWKTNFKMPGSHQGLVVKKTLFDHIGYFSPDFKICMDYDWLLRAYRKKEKIYVENNIILSVVRSTGISSKTDWNSLYNRFAEEHAAHLKNSPSLLYTLMYKIYMPIYIAYRRFKTVLKLPHIAFET